MVEDKPRGVGGPPPRQAPAAPAVEEPKPVAAASFLVKREAGVPAASTSAPDELDEIDLAFEAEARKRSLGTHQEAPSASTAPTFAPPAPASAGYVPASAPAAPEPYGSEMKKFSVRVPENLRDRYRAAFTYTAAIEGDQTLNDVFLRFVEEDCERRERLYNNGKPFTGGTQPLLRGRPPLKR